MLNKNPMNQCDTQKAESKKQNNSLLLEGTIILTLHFKNRFYNRDCTKSIQCLTDISYEYQNTGHPCVVT